MSFKTDHSDYTSRARRFVAKYPLLNNIGVQACFWVLAFVLLITIVHFANLATMDAMQVPMGVGLLPNIIMAALSGILYGSALGVMDYYFDKEIFRNKPLGKIIILKPYCI